MGERESKVLKAPFPWFGGKGKVASEIWRRFGDVELYLEAFGGSCGVLLNRPGRHKRKSEIINDINGFIINAYRAIEYDAAGVWRHCDYPISQIDMYARHAVLQSRYDKLVNQLASDPYYYDIEIAGWWIWGASASIGNNWHRRNLPKAKPQITNNAGVHALNGGYALLERLQVRLRHVQFLCTDWESVVADSVITGSNKFRTVGILVDPPYISDDREKDIYGEFDDDSVAEKSYRWCIETAGRLPQVRIAYCTYEGHFPCPEGWSTYRWRTQGGMGNMSKRENNQGRINKARELVYFSPGCLEGEQLSLW